MKRVLTDDEVDDMERYALRTEGDTPAKMVRRVEALVLQRTARGPRALQRLGLVLGAFAIGVGYEHMPPSLLGVAVVLCCWLAYRDSV